MEKKIILLLAAILSLTFLKAEGQDIPGKKNTISFTPLPLLDRTISISYSRKINDRLDFTFNPRVRIQNKQNPTNKFIIILLSDPYWLYNKYTIRTGLNFHKKQFFFEPILQYSYAFFHNQKIQTSDPQGVILDEYVIMDRNYISTGLITLFGINQETKLLKLKYFAGFGFHVKQYEEIKYDIITHDEKIPIWDLNTYNKSIASFHLGMEIGFRF